MDIDFEVDFEILVGDMDSKELVFESWFIFLEMSYFVFFSVVFFFVFIEI